MAAGCEVKSFLDPSEMSDPPKKPMIVPILRNLDTGIEEPNSQFAGATAPRPEDLIPAAGDYVIASIRSSAVRAQPAVSASTTI